MQKKSFFTEILVIFEIFLIYFFGSLKMDFEKPLSHLKRIRTSDYNKGTLDPTRDQFNFVQYKSLYCLFWLLKKF